MQQKEIIIFAVLLKTFLIKTDIYFCSEDTLVKEYNDHCHDLFCGVSNFSTLAFALSVQGNTIEKSHITS